MRWSRYGSEINVKGFTLFEVLISILILATVLSTVFASYTGAFRIVGETESQAQIYAMARIAFERILEDLESVYVPLDFQPLEGEEDGSAYEFEGQDKAINGQDADSLRFASRAHLSFGEEDQSGITAEISYTVEENESAGSRLTLFRSDRLQVEAASQEGGGGVPLCENLASVDFKFMDAEGEERDDWEPGKGIPQMISIFLEFVNPSNPESSLGFATRVALPVRGTAEEVK